MQALTIKTCSVAEAHSGTLSFYAFLLEKKKINLYTSGIWGPVATGEGLPIYWLARGLLRKTKGEKLFSCSTDLQPSKPFLNGCNWRKGTSDYSQQLFL